VQLTKLPGIIAGRAQAGDGIRDALADAAVGVTVGWQVPETQSTYWFLRLKFESDAFSVDKAEFCRALSAEGIPVGVNYRAIPAEYPWFQNKAVFGRSGFPWDCSDYHGPKKPQYHIENAIEAVEAHFRITVHERYGQSEVDDIVEAVTKVAAAFAR